MGELRSGADIRGSYPPNLRLSPAIVAVLCGSLCACGALLYESRSANPNIHLVLDTALAVLSGVLALFFWSIGSRTRERFPLWIAATFAVTWLLDCLHLAITIRSLEQGMLPDAAGHPWLTITWALPTYILPCGVGLSLWLLQRKATFAPYKLALALIGLSVAIVLVSPFLAPLFPAWTTVIRPNLVLTPVMWAIVGVSCWHWRQAARTLPWFALMAVLLFLGDFAMLCSKTPDDTASILAHLGKSLGSLVLLISKMQMASNDIEERILAENKFRGLLESAPDAIVVVDRSGNIVLVNAQLVKIFGYPHEEIIGRTIGTLIPARYGRVHPGHVATFFSGPHARPMGSGLDLFGLRRDGTEFPVEISLSPLVTPEGTLVSAVIRDVTRRKQIENEIRRLNSSLEERAEELTAANQELEAFTYTAAHDLRAPLRHLHGYSTFLKESWYDRLDAEGQHFLDRIMTSTKQMATLLDELLNFSRLGRVEMQKHEVSLSSLVARIREDLQSEPGSERITWHIADLPAVEGDLALLNQVLVNLLSNAVKYSHKHPQPEITIGFQTDGRYTTTIFVRDNGAGFDMQYANKLFQVFQRLHKTKDFEGTGIGLAIVRRIVERHGGRVWAEGKVGEGATFYFSLPTRSEPHGQTRVHSAGR